jgi:hypothetical protein
MQVPELCKSPLLAATAACLLLLPLAAAAAASLNWGKLGLRYWEVGLRRGAVYTVLLLLALFYVLPVAAVQGILQVRPEQRHLYILASGSVCCTALSSFLK